MFLVLYSEYATYHMYGRLAGDEYRDRYRVGQGEKSCGKARLLKTTISRQHSFNYKAAVLLYIAPLDNRLSYTAV